MICNRAHTVIAGVAQPVGGFREIPESTGYGPVLHAASGPEAIALVQAHLPELGLADLVLPGIDGIQLACRILNLPLNNYPAMVIFDPAGCMPGGYEWLLKCGVMVLTHPLTESGLSAAMEALSPENRELPPVKQAFLKTLMDDLGIPEHPGRQYLHSAVSLAWMDSRCLNSLKKQLYAVVARMHSTDAARVERALRYVIDTAWRTGAIAHQHRIFGYTIDARRGKPTCGEMIARLADILRWEGRE